MTLQNFESYIGKPILSRGRDYYKSGNVVSFEFEGEEWIAEVEGSEGYTVASRADSRSNYRDVCGYIKEYEKACGRSAASSVRDELAAKYARCLVFLDKLRKV